MNNTDIIDDQHKGPMAEEIKSSSMFSLIDVELVAT